VTWFERRRRRAAASGETAILDPSAWRFNGPTSDTASASTTVDVDAHGRALTAAATQVASRKVKRASGVDEKTAECWAMYDEVGELRYVANAIAGRMGQAELFLKRNGERVDGSEDEDPILALLTEQMTERLGLNIFVAGLGYLAGVPKEGPKAQQDKADPDFIPPQGDSKTETTAWMICSALEVRAHGEKVTIRGLEYERDEVYLEKIWDPHPADWGEADSPVRSALPVLRELVGLSQHVSAQIDSRLAGAGLYWIPNEILAAAKVPEEGAQTTYSSNPVLNAIMTTMMLPLEDRENASAVVPGMFGAPGDWIDKIRYDTFATPFDENTPELREEAIRRLGLNLDAPPELLQGMGDANHWGMWLVRDEVIQAHVKPRLDLVSDGYTTGFYRPILKQLQALPPEERPAGLPDGDPEEYELDFDVSGLVQRPNRLADASSLHTAGAINDKALREAGGFEESDAPSSMEKAISIALQVGQGNPQLLDNLGEIVQAIVALLDGTPTSGPETVDSQREPGSLTPLVPANGGQRPLPVRTAPNGTPATREGATVAEADTLPRAGSPVG
jgi:hypothetical protein